MKMKTDNKAFEQLLNMPKSYKNDAYGELHSLYDFVKANDITKMNDAEKQSFLNELNSLKNKLIFYVKTEPIRPSKFENITNRLKYIYGLIYSNNFFDVNVFNDAENKAIELNDAFDFGTINIQSQTKKVDKNLLIENAESRILKAINEAKELLKNKPIKKGGKKKYKTKETKPKQLKDFLINSENFNDKEAKKIENQIKKHFQEPIVNDYKKGRKQKLNYLILSLAERIISVFNPIGKNC